MTQERSDDRATGRDVKNRPRRRDLIRASAAMAAGALTGGVMTPGVAMAEGRPQSRLYDVLKRGKLLVGTGSTNPPWHFEDGNGNLIGLDIEMGRIIAKGLFDDPQKMEFIRQTDDSRIPNLITDKIDITIQFMTVTAGRAQQAEFSIPYYRSGAALLLPKDGKYKSYDELKAAGGAATASVLQNVYAEELVRDALPDAKVLTFDSQANVVQAVASGRAAAGVVGKAMVRWLMVQQPDRFADAGHYWYPQTYSAAVKPGDPIWLNFVNTCFHEAMVGVDFKIYRDAIKKFFAETLPAPKIGAPNEYFG